MSRAGCIYSGSLYGKLHSQHCAFRLHSFRNGREEELQGSRRRGNP